MRFSNKSESRLPVGVVNRHVCVGEKHKNLDDLLSDEKKTRVIFFSASRWLAQSIANSVQAVRKGREGGGNRLSDDEQCYAACCHGPTCVHVGGIKGTSAVYRQPLPLKIQTEEGESCSNMFDMACSSIGSINANSFMLIRTGNDSHMSIPHLQRWRLSKMVDLVLYIFIRLQYLP